MHKLIVTGCEIKRASLFNLGHVETSLFLDDGEGVSPQPGNHHGTQVRYILPLPKGMDTPTNTILGNILLIDYLHNKERILLTLASTTMTSSPKYANCLAAISPLTPAPNTTTLNGILPAKKHKALQRKLLNWIL